MRPPLQRTGRGCPEIRDARADDLAAIHGIAEAVSVEVAGEDPGGFLVSQYSLAKYTEVLALAESLLCAVVDGDVVGFALVLRRADLPLSEGGGAGFDGVRPRLVVKQVAIAPGHQRVGLGRSLYDEIFRRHGDETLGATILHRPRNEASIIFHRRAGFVHAAEVPGEQGMVYGFWIREPAVVV